MQLHIKKMRDVPTPTYSREGDAALDMRACLDAPLVLDVGARAEIPSGVAFAIPHGYVGLLMPRGGLGIKGLTLANMTGVIDSNYRGEVMMNVVNTGTAPITIKPHDRIMQLVVAPIAVCQVVEVDVLDETNRGESRYTSSGV